MKSLRNSILITILFVCLLATNTINLTKQIEEKFESKENTDSISYDTPKTSNPDTWTILIYLDGDNNLESVAIDDFLEMSSIGEDQNINILVQFDRAFDDDPDSGYSSAYLDWQDTLRFNITQGLEPYKVNALQDLPEVDMDDPLSLSDFITWGFTCEPDSDHYVLVLWDHGGGWEGLCSDDNSGGSMDLLELKEALSTAGEHFDLIAFDACLMGMAEVFYQIKDWCDVCIASEETIPWEGFPYDTILNDLKNNPSMNAEELGNIIVGKYIQQPIDQSSKDETLSCINMTNIENLSSAINELGIALKNGINMYRLQIQQAKEASECYSSDIEISEYIDLYDFANEINNRIFNYTIMNATQRVMNNVTAAVLSESHNSNSPDSHGISIYFPCDSSSLFEYNSYADFCDTNQWDEFLEAYHNVPFEDKYEDNDAFSTAFDLRAYERTWLSTINGSGVQKNDDYYMIEVSSSDTRLIVDVSFNGEMGNIDINLYDSNHDEVDYSWLENSDREYIDCAVSPGIYYILVYWGDEGNLYDLWWDDYIPSDSDDDDDDDEYLDWTKIPGFNIEFLLIFTFVSILSITIIIQKKRKMI